MSDMRLSLYPDVGFCRLNPFQMLGPLDTNPERHPMTTDFQPAAPLPQRRSTTFTRLGAALAGCAERAAQRQLPFGLDAAEARRADPPARPLPHEPGERRCE